MNGGLVTGVNGVNPVLVGGLNPPVLPGGPAVIGQPPLTQVQTENLLIKRTVQQKMKMLNIFHDDPRCEFVRLFLPPT